MTQTVNGEATFKMPVEFQIEVPEPTPPIRKDFTTDDVTVQQLIPKNILPQSIALWLKTSTGWSYQTGTPTSIFELEDNEENNLLIYNNAGEVAGQLIIIL